MRLICHKSTLGDAINDMYDFLYDGLTFGSTIYFSDGLRVRSISASSDCSTLLQGALYEVTYVKHLGYPQSNNYWKALQISIRT